MQENFQHLPLEETLATDDTERSMGRGTAVSSYGFLVLYIHFLTLFPYFLCGLGEVLNPLCLSFPICEIGCCRDWELSLSILPYSTVMGS